MSNIRKIMATHQSLLNKEIGEDKVENGAPPRRDENKVLSADPKQLAIELISELPIIPNNDNIMELMVDMENGSFQDISPVQDVYKNWDAWVERSRELLKSKGSIINTSKLRTKIRKLT